LLFVSCAISLSAIAQRDNGFYISYELNGKEFSFKDGDVLTYTRHDTNANYKIPHTKYSIFVTSANSDEYKISFLFYTKALSKLASGKLKTSSILGFKKALPSVHVKLDIKENEHYKFFGTKDFGDGDIEITSVKDDWVEGKFELKVPESYGNKSIPLVLKNGIFKFKMKN
jgi:hypothetical protein